VRDEATSTAFGSDNNYLEIIDDRTDRGLEVRTSSLFGDTYNALTVFSFDFHDSAAGSGELFFGYTGVDNRLGSTRARAQFSLSNGTVGGVSGGDTTSYDLDTVYRAFLVLNDTTSTQTYLGKSVAAESAGVWLQEGSSSCVPTSMATSAPGYSPASVDSCLAVFVIVFSTRMFPSLSVTHTWCFLSPRSTPIIVLYCLFID